MRRKSDIAGSAQLSVMLNLQFSGNPEPIDVFMVAAPVN
jgi:hypothetical protein